MHEHFELLSNILRGQWLMNLQEASAFLPVLDQLMTGKAVSLPNALEMAKPTGALVANMSDGYLRMESYESLDQAPAGSISVVKNVGPMMKNDYCYALGTASMGRMMQQADAHPNIIGHILWKDTPGGHVDGTENFARINSSLAKPYLTYVDGQMCSAGYWGGCSADAIVAGGKTAQIGSIGTMISFQDLRNYYEKMGVKFHDIFATASKDKNQTYLQALKGNYKPIQEQLLNPMNEIFLSEVKAHRSGDLDLATEDVLTGKVYLAEAALEYGLIDSIGTFEEALVMVKEMADSGYKKRNAKKKK